jgi:hypothetical protein
MARPNTKICILLLQFVWNVEGVSSNSQEDLDTTIFGSCVMHVKIFSNFPANDEIMQNFLTSNLNKVKTIHNSSKDMPYTTFGKIVPALKSNEVCSLHVVVGVLKRQYWELHGWVKQNPMALATSPKVYYIFIPRSYETFIEGNALSHQYGELPATIFIMDYSSKEYYFLCTRCSVNMYPLYEYARPQKVPKDSSISTLSQDSFKRYWRTQHFRIHIHDPSRVLYIGGCSKWIWLNMAKKESLKPNCTSFHAYWDSLVSSVEVNMTAYVRPLYEGDERFRTGTIRPYHPITPEDYSATSYGLMMYASAYLLYSDCSTRDQIISMQAWTGSISSDVWALFACTLVVVVFVVGIEKGRSEHTNSVSIGSLDNALIGTARLVLRQGMPTVHKGLILCVIFCHTMTILTNVYENKLTSQIIVPPTKSAMDIFDFLLKGETIAYVDTAPIIHLTNWLAQQHKDPLPKVTSERIAFLQNDIIGLATFGSKPAVFQFLREQDLKTLINPKFRTANCDRFAVPNSMYKLSLLHRFQHALRARFVHMTNLFLENGIDQFWKEQREIEKEMLVQKRFRYHNTTDSSALHGNLISFWNLIPFLIVSVSLLNMGVLVVVVENHDKLLHLARRAFQILRGNVIETRIRVQRGISHYREIFRNKLRLRG